MVNTIIFNGAKIYKRERNSYTTYAVKGTSDFVSVVDGQVYYETSDKSIEVDDLDMALLQLTQTWNGQL